MNKESKLNLNAIDYAVSHCDSNKTYNGLEVQKMLCNAYIAGNKDNDKDEEIRKALINVFATHKDYEIFFGVSVVDILSWLEKQVPIDENEIAKGVLIEVANSIMRWLDSNCAEGNMCLSGMECEDIENAVRNANWQKIYGYMKKKLEKQGENKFGQREECLDCQFNYSGECKGSCDMKKGEQKEYTFKSIPRLLDMIEPSDRAKAYCQKLIDTLTKEGYNIDAKIVEEVLKGWNGEDVPMAVMDEQKPQGKSALEAIKEEKVDNANKIEPKDYSSIDPYFGKPINNVEPKFHEGDWVLNDVCLPVQIASVKDGLYIFTEGDAISVSFVDENFHLWTISDAKDGDVLVGRNKDDVILIFRGIGNEEWTDVIDYYCRYDCCLEEFIVQEDLEFWGYVNDNQLKPATKEQSARLFQKMKEAGYVWDDKKKELKKIEQNPAWSEEDERTYRGLHNLIYATPYCNSRKKLSNWLKSLKNRTK